jgi:cell wall-associated NlpC family hydrolase
MTSQLLFGELFDIIEEKEGFLQIINVWDNYEGWIDSSQATILTDEEHHSLSSSARKTVTEPFAKVTLNKYSELMVPAGGDIYTSGKKLFEIKGLSFLFDETSSRPVDVAGTAKKFLNAPYLWGGKTCFGIDCSGFTQVLFKTIGIPIPRDSSQQVNSGEPVSLLSETLPGDLAFFDDEEGNIIHVGLLLSPEEIIHASSRVRLDSIDHHGIFNKELRRYTHKLRTIRRVNK